MAMIGRPRFRGLFQKYFLVLFLAVVVPLAANGISEAWFGYRDQRARLDQLLGVEARSAASRIQGFLDGITSQLGWLVQLPWTEVRISRNGEQGFHRIVSTDSRGS